MHLYSSYLSTRATISSIIISKLFPACFSCNNNFNLLKCSSGSVGKNNVSEKPEAKTAGDLSNLITNLSHSLFHSFCLMSKFISFPNS